MYGNIKISKRKIDVNLMRNIELLIIIFINDENLKF